jgi:predicted ATPase
MIQSIDLRNFKSIKSKHFPLRNLNILLGLNGQGKSSFIQSLLLLRQSADSLRKGQLLLNGNEFKIGSTKDALYQYAKDPLSIGLQFNDTDPYLMEFEYQIESDVFNQKSSLEVISNNYIANNAGQPLLSSNFQYLNANRIEPKTIHSKSYTSVVSQSNIGSLGEYTVHFLETRGSEDIKFENCLHHKTKSSKNSFNEDIKDRRIINQVNLWLGEISPDINVKTTSISSDYVKLEYEFEQPTYGKTMSFKPENVGFGISYALHVVTALLASRPGELIIIENPESHIHPRGQAELGKLIALVAQNDIQVIIETHSDHILNGIRVAVKEAAIDKNKVLAYYFTKVIMDTEQYSKILNIEIDKNGTLSDYPENLLDEWSNQLSKLI